MQTFSKQQVTAAEDIVTTMMSGGERWVKLSAQMQSGKTDTFYLAACQLLQLGVISHVLIMCGSSEKELKRQVTNRRDMIRKYRKYIKVKLQEAKPDISTDELIDEIDSIIDKVDNDDVFTYMWNCDMQKYIKDSNAEPFKNTLFIWEESHFAQSIDQVPARFLIKNKISGNGNREHLKMNDNYVLSVSATGFSESIDIFTMNQDKKDIVLHTGDTYYGVKDMVENGQIIGFQYFEEGLEEALDKALTSDTPKYAIVRILNPEKYVSALSIISSKGFKAVEYNSKALKDKKCSIKSLNDLSKEPKENQVIIIKGMCRMGKQVPKEHISFVMEASDRPNADTFLQGLLGRMCGYGQHKDVSIYLSEYALQMGDLDKYIQWNKTSDIKYVPLHASNVVARMRTTTQVLLRTKSKEYFMYDYDKVENL